MKYAAAALLISLSNSQPTKKSIINVLESVGIEADDTDLSNFMSKIEGKDINELVSEGVSKLGSLSVASGGAPAGGAPAADSAAETKKEEVKEETESSDEDMGFSLFD